MDTPWGRRRERRLAELERFRAARRVVAEDVTVLGEQLTALHVETLADTLDDEAAGHYREALAGYEQARTALTRAEAGLDADAVLAVVHLVEEARWRRACVLARVAGQALPTRRDPCFFDPRHLPAVADVAWRPPGGVVRDVPVCPECRNRLAEGEEPEVRLVRVGDRRVPWWEGGVADPAADPGGVRHRSRVVNQAAVESVARRAGDALGGR